MYTKSRPICAPWIHTFYCFIKSKAPAEIQIHKFLGNSCKTWCQVVTQHVTSHLMCPQNHTKPSFLVKSNNSQLVKNARSAVYCSIGKSKSGVSQKVVQPHQTSTTKNSPTWFPSVPIWVNCHYFHLSGPTEAIGLA